MTGSKNNPNGGSQAEAEILKNQEAEVDRVLTNRRADFRNLSDLIDRRLAEGEKSYSGGMVKLQSELKELQKKIEFSEAMKKELSKKIRDSLKKVIVETKRSEEEIVDQIKKRENDDDAKMMEIAQSVGFKGPAQKLFPDDYEEPETEDPRIKKLKEVLGKSKDFLKEKFDAIASRFSQKTEEDKDEGSDSEPETLACPHCGGTCKDAFCENTGKPMSQDK